MTDHPIHSVLINKELNPNVIQLNDETLGSLNIESNSITLHFGKIEKELIISINNDLKTNQIMIPCQLGENISIPVLPYDSYFNTNHLYLGPVIGFLVNSTYYKNIQKMATLRFSNYGQIKGLICIFNTKTINQANQTISGYYYEPTANKFIEGTFPYPTAIYNRSFIKPNIYKHLKKHIGDNIFNYPYRNDNKYLFWHNMSSITDIGEHLPSTQKYNGVTSLVQMLAKYESVFLKPTKLSQGRGIFHIKKADHGYLISDTKGNKTLINSIERLAKVLNRNIKNNRRYIIQQEIPFKHSGKKIDFRVYLQKDRTKNWKYSGLETKVAKVGSVISNSSFREQIMPGEVALKEIYHLTEEQVNQKIVEITELCTKVLMVMETGEAHLGDIAMDLIIDQDGKVWLLEVQVNYAAEKKANRTIDERRILPYILPTPFEYAKALAGF